MRFLFSLAVIVPSVLCSITTSLVSSISTTEVCSTRKSSKSVKNVPTNTIQSTAPAITIIASIKSTPITTVTAKPSTSTSIITAIITITLTASTITDVFSTTSTYYNTATITQTVTELYPVLVTSSTTVVASAVITTPPGFISIDTSTGEENIGQTPARKVKRHPHAPVNNQPLPKGLNHNGQFCINGQDYPAAVTCAIIKQAHVTKEIISIYPASTKTLPALTTTVLSTLTHTSTSTVLPSDASTTLSFSTTLSSTVSIQTIISVTSTSTLAVTFTSTTSLYAACATPNILGPETSTGTYPYDNYWTDSSSNVNVFTPTASSAYDCCVACITTANCYYSAFAASSSYCNIIVGASCPAGQPLEGYFFTTPAANGFEASYSNGLCGSLGDAGSE